MKKIAALLAILVLSFASTAFALYELSERGEWPKTWPKELEPLRASARTLIGPEVAARHFAIRFTDREAFESAWPHLLSVKSKDAPIFLVRGENFFLGEGKEAAAGVVVHCPPEGQWENPATPEGPIDGVQEPHMRWMNTNYIELVVDGEIVDLNRIQLPADTPIIDERFKEERKR